MINNIYKKSIYLKQTNRDNKMNGLKKQDGVYYTQNIENLPIEERVFFTEGKGMSATSEYYREAIAEEVAEWNEYKNTHLCL